MKNPINRLVIHKLLTAGAAVLLAVGTASAATYSFNLNPPNTAENETEDTIRVTGAGVFDTDLGVVQAQGSFTHQDGAGAVVARGTWRATSFDSFLSFGGPHPGFQGGELEIIVTLFPEGGAPVTDVTMTVTCLVNAPAGFTEEEGTMVGDFTEKTGGTTLFHLQQ